MTDEERFNKDKALVVAMIKYILIALISIVLIYFSTKLILVLVPFLIGFLLSSASFKLAGIFSHKKSGDSDKRRRGIAKVIFVILIILLLGLLILGAAEAVSQIGNAVNTLSKYASSLELTDIQNKVNSLISSLGTQNDDIIMATVKDNIANLVKTFSQKIPGIINSMFNSVLGIVGNLPYDFFVVVCVLMSGWYFISDGPQVLRMYANNVPNKKFRAKTLTLLNELSNTLFRVLGGYLLLLIVTVLESWIFFLIAGVKYSFILALITGLVDFLPVLGVSAMMIPIAVYNILGGNYFAGIVLLIGLAIISAVRRVIEPAVLGKTMKLHPLLTLFGMLAGVAIWGAIGFLLGPTVLIIIIQIMKVFSLDKRLKSFLSRVLKRFMTEPEPQEKD